MQLEAKLTSYKDSKATFKSRRVRVLECWWRSLVSASCVAIQAYPGPQAQNLSWWKPPERVSLGNKTRAMVTNSGKSTGA